MSALPAEKARSQIAELVDSAVKQTVGLQDILEQELVALRAQDADRLQQVMDDKSARVETLRRIDTERSALCADQGIAPGADQMDRLIAICGNDSAIAHSWDRLMQLAIECNAMNMKIGAIIRLRRQQIDDGIAFLRGDTAPNATYHMSGSNERAGAMRSLAQA
ncbi:MAG: flagellar protein FlgN [Pseudomonadota bacterium]